jgi:hypothetical protein
MAFIKGMDLCRAFCGQVVEPLIQHACPGMPHALGLLGCGSDVLGYDDAVSTDHMWGPRFHLFLREEDMQQRISLDRLFREHFPTTFMGHSVHFSGDPGPDTEIRVPAPITEGPVSPLYWVHTPTGFLKEYLGLFPSDAFDWLALSEHRLLGLASGQLFVDNIRFSERLEAFRHYPHEVRMHLIASQWTLIAEERAFTKRCATVGDDMGSRLVSARIVERLMRLCFLYANRYAPYSKWFGTAFSQLSVPEDLRTALAETLTSETIARREPALVRAQVLVARRHNETGLTRPVSIHAHPYYERDIQVIDTDELAASAREAISDPLLRALPASGTFSQIGNFVQLSDPPQLAPIVATFYRQAALRG